MSVTERRVEAPGGATVCLEVDGPGAEQPVVFVHGNPSNAEDWRPFLERLDGRRRALAPHVLGWGPSERPAGFHWTMENLDRWVEGLLDALGVRRFDLVVHDWGSIALAAAQRRPQDVGRVVVIDAVPLLPGYRWHWVARMWRRRGVGELVNATMSRPGTGMLLRQATPRRGTLPELVERIHEHLDAGTKRAILELYRDADPDRLAHFGRELDRLSGPSLVIWGDHDPYLGSELAEAYGRALGGVPRVELIPDAGHWPWLDQPDVIELVASFLEAS